MDTVHVKHLKKEFELFDTVKSVYHMDNYGKEDENALVIGFKNGSSVLIKDNISEERYEHYGYLLMVADANHIDTDGELYYKDSYMDTALELKEAIREQGLTANFNEKWLKENTLKLEYKEMRPKYITGKEWKSYIDELKNSYDDKNKIINSIKNNPIKNPRINQKLHNNKLFIDGLLKINEIDQAQHEKINFINSKLNTINTKSLNQNALKKLVLSTDNAINKTLGMDNQITKDIKKSIMEDLVKTTKQRIKEHSNEKSMSI